MSVPVRLQILLTLVGLAACHTVLGCGPRNRTSLSSFAQPASDEGLRRGGNPLRQARRREAPGRRAAAVPHAFNKQPKAVSDYTDELARGRNGGETVRRQAEEIRKAPERAASQARNRDDGRARRSALG